MMKTVCMIGAGNIFFEKTVLRFIKGYVYISEAEVRVSSPTGCELLIIDCGSKFFDIGATYDCVIFKNDFFTTFDIEACLKKQALVIVAENSLKAVKMLKKLGIEYTVCGLSSGCGITPSSISEDRMTVSVSKTLGRGGAVLAEEGEFELKGELNAYNLCPAMLGGAIESIVKKQIFI